MKGRPEREGIGCTRSRLRALQDWYQYVGTGHTPRPALATLEAADHRRRHRHDRPLEQPHPPEPPRLLRCDLQVPPTTANVSVVYTITDIYVASLQIIVRPRTERRLLLILACAMLVLNAAALSLAPGCIGPVGDEGGAADQTTGGDRDLIARGGPYDGLGPPDEVHEGVEGPEYPEDKE